ncbi:MAG: beta-ketoacyl-ACP synthase [Gammaproteobacteria bacterium]|nr:beta-ketoacyl-ACP synthase [Gammaproteobacteria bacterium]
MTRRVVVTGMGAVSALGSDWQSAEAGLRARRNFVVYKPEYAEYRGLNTNLVAPVDFQPPEHYSRKQLRTMGRVAVMSVRAAELALTQSGLLADPVLKSGRTGVAFGSSSGSPPAIAEFGQMLVSKTTVGLNATSYVRMMSHTAAVNIGVFFGVVGRVITTSSACTAGSQGIGYAYEAIKFGRQTVMIAGGGEELDPTQSAVFDTLYATSTRNDSPQTTPQPYDLNRDGLVIGEGAGALVLEEREFALARGATIFAEIVGFGTNADGQHVTRPNEQTMAHCLRLGLEDAGIPASAVGYVNGHGTATEHGDIAETQATAAVFGRPVPMSSLKSYIGHTLGACGALEAWLSIEMMNNDWYAPTINLDNPDPRCAELDYVQGEGRVMRNEFVMSNNFAFGGINTTLVFKRTL